MSNDASAEAGKRQSSMAFGGEKGTSQILQTPVMSEPSTALLHHGGHKLHEVFQLKQGRYSDLPANKISEMMKSNSLDSAPTQSLLSMMNAILDESIERKNAEIPHRVACLLRKVVQEIERRISTQVEHIRNQNNLIKAREEKYQSRIRVLETLATGTGEETQIAAIQVNTVKTEKSKSEETQQVEKRDMDKLTKEKENNDRLTSDMDKLTKEKENNDRLISDLRQDLAMTKKTNQERCQQLEIEANETKRQLESRIREVETLLAVSYKKAKELEASSESKFHNWNKKQNIFHNFVDFQIKSIQDLRMSSETIRRQVVDTQNRWYEETNGLGKELKVLVDAADNYHTVLAENRKLYNEVLELKGNIRVYCRIRPFLPGEAKKATTVDFIGDNGELAIVNPSKQGKDGQKTFKFNKVYSPAASQEDVFLDTQPLIRSVLDGFNVCIFAYGQTGSGKTYTMSGPNTPTKETWGINYRALNDLFDISRGRTTFTFEIGVQMVEIYNEQVRDLLSNDVSQKRLGILSTPHPNGLAVPDATMNSVKSTADVLQLMEFGQTNRAMSSTALNERSSRSHSVLTVHVRGVDLKTGSVSRGCLHLIDLAGSERVDRSEVTGDRLKEAQHINKSLSALGDVIFALAQKSSHVPYRNSKLTQVLQSSLGGQAKTLMFVQISPNVESYSETFSTLKFAERVSGVELGAARSNKEGKDVRDLMEQVASLKDTIAKKDEEIEQLQQVKELGTQSPRAASERRGIKTIKHSSSTPRLASLAGTNQHYKESHESNINGEDSGQSSPAGFNEDANFEERLSDVSDGDLSTARETDGSSVDAETSKTQEIRKEKTPKGSPRVSRLQIQKTEQSTTALLRAKDSLKSPNLRKTATAQTVMAASKLQKSKPFT